MDPRPTRSTRTEPLLPYTPRVRSYARWYAQTPPGFVFTVKGSRFISHRLRRRDVEQPLANFLASGIFNLREKLGPFLWQLPPSFRFDAERLETFFAQIGRASCRERVCQYV